MLRHYFLFIFLFLFYPNSNAQNKIWNLWVFGSHGGLDFNSGHPISVPNIAVQTPEGTASISDNATGLPLFYTDGVKVWNRNNQQMPGNTVSLGGDVSATQSALIVPAPGHSSLYYVFTVSAQIGLFSATNGLSVSVIDMAMQGGLGDVSQQPQSIVGPTCEKLTACKMAGGNGYWVVTHLFNSNEFYAIPLTASGLGTPVISHQGTVVQNLSGVATESQGYMKISPDNRYIATATGRTQNRIELFNFNNATGTVSAPIFSDSVRNINSYFPYGLEFSPNSNLLYVSIFDASYLYQYNLLVGAGPSIIASKYTINITPSRVGALQIGPDGKIYCTCYGTAINQLDRINNPNVIGAGCDYIQNVLVLIPSDSSTIHSTVLGLPNCINDLFLADTSTHMLIATAVSTNLSCSDQCVGTATVYAGYGKPPYTYNWQPGNMTTASVIDLCGGIYTVTVTDSIRTTVTDSVVVISPPPVSIMLSCPDSAFCQNDSAQICALGSFASLWWNSGDTGSCIKSRISFTYYAVASDTNGCTVTSNNLETHVYSPSQVHITVSTDTLIASPGPYLNFQWYFNDSLIPGANSGIYLASQQGNYRVMVTDSLSGGCTSISGVVTIQKTGLSNIDESDITIFPDYMSTGVWDLSVSSIYIGTPLEVFDIQGKLIYRTQISNIHSTIALNVSPGIYLLHLHNTKGERIKKLLKN